MRTLAGSKPLPSPPSKVRARAHVTMMMTSLMFQPQAQLLAPSVHGIFDHFPHLTDALLQTTKTINSLHSSLSVVSDDFIRFEGVFIGTDEALAMDTKDVEHHIDTLSSRTPALATDNVLVIKNALSICKASSSYPLDLQPLSPLDNFSTFIRET
ncbi:hypothetical protein BDR04DRAFT_154429 [Suillus decipiens]|nr:hypothetical protein BDR04DRAFT_154429 [Suillus decipiens]